jgi:hypothetical protein
VATGPGEPRHLPLGKLQLRESSFLDANRVLLWAAEPGASIRGWVQEIATGAIRPVTPEGVEPWRSPMVKDAVLARQADGTLTWFPLTGEEPRPTRASVPEGSYCIRTTPDGKWTFVSTLGVPTQIDRIDLLTGRRNLWKSMAPPDLTGVVFMHPWVRTTPDGEAYVYSYLRVFQDLFLVEGLR